MKLREVLAIPDSIKFLDALADLAIPPGTNVYPPPDKRHEIRQMISTLSGLALYAGNDGIWKWLIEDGQAHWFAKSQVWLTRIGAGRTLAYLESAAAAFPEGRIPTDDSERADLILDCDEIEAKLDEIDRAHQDSFREMAESLRRYVQENFELFRKELEDEENRIV